ncbi:Dolichyl-diphosphooligosaccharide-protein glycosyltransferase subunit OST2 [Tolypocladium capitatum]|uniref:Dolichyl-diphosphooligosaccharide--protein glycosyltransferase subunit OST2 n=1 Tax=Tolypocladium capitatum TaxID=45235 RepID=A0A2K3QAZ7_9HYPO|nr:Dolichyl-diphosphooligosaccharide-protein glycosyltransferase subunit OST2 [Tolypocladium capitatum]
MAPKKNAREPTSSSAATTQAGTTTAGSVPPQPKLSSTSAATPTASKGGAANWDQVLQNIYHFYLKKTPQRTRLVDAFLLFLAVVGALQFLYCILAGNYPFNAFLSGFCATVGQFVLTVSLRIQTTEANKSDFPAVSPERAFADFVVCSLILHFFCVNFIN